MPCWQEFASPEQLLVHGWGRIKNLNAYSLLALSTHKNVKCYPTMTKAPSAMLSGSCGVRALAQDGQKAEREGFRL